MFCNPPKSSNPLSKSSDQVDPQPAQVEQKRIEQKQIVEEIADINILRESMLRETHRFDNELDQLQQNLLKKANELQILASKEMNQISDKNFELVEGFVNYQKRLIQKLQEKNSNWDKFESELIEVQQKLEEIMNEESLVSKLAQTEILEEEISELIEQIDELNERKNKKR